VGEEVVTRVFDAPTKTVRESLFLPLYPLAEWIALNWWRLLFAVPRSRSSRDYAAPYHSLVAASEGFALPALTLEPMGEEVRISWSSRRLERAPLEFVGDGVVFVRREEVRAELSSFVNMVTGRLLEAGIAETLLQEEWRAVLELGSEEEEFCRYAAALGLDPFNVEDEQASALVEASKRIPQALHEEFFSSAELSNLRNEARSIERVIESLQGPNEALEPIRSLRGVWAPREASAELSFRRLDAPWKVGYAAARRLRAHLGLDGAALPSFESLANALGLEEHVLEAEIRRARNLVSVDGLVVHDDEERPGFAVRAGSKEARRFAFCRELFEYLTTRGPAPLVVTKGATYRQQKNRAFAAEFLLPSEALRSRVEGQSVTLQKVDEIAREFGVSWAVVNHQLDNHRIAEVIPA
jgi:hypothetical protein